MKLEEIKKILLQEDFEEYTSKFTKANCFMQKPIYGFNRKKYFLNLYVYDFTKYPQCPIDCSTEANAQFNLPDSNTVIVKYLNVDIHNLTKMYIFFEDFFEKFNCKFDDEM